MKRPRELAERIVLAIEAWHDNNPANEVARSDAGVIRQIYFSMHRAALFREASIAAQIEFVTQAIREAAE